MKENQQKTTRLCMIVVSATDSLFPFEMVQLILFVKNAPKSKAINLFLASNLEKDMKNMSDEFDPDYDGTTNWPSGWYIFPTMVVMLLCWLSCLVAWVTTVAPAGW